MKTIEQEKQEAKEKYGHFNSTHEVYGVLKEEVDEFWWWVKTNPKTFEIEDRRDGMIHELTQIAAIAQRAIIELQNNEIRWI